MADNMNYGGEQQRVPWVRADWRWRRAEEIVNRRLYSTRRRDGHLVQDTVRYFRMEERATTERGRCSAAKRYPHIAPAIEVAREPGLRALEIKARTLAGQSSRAIGRRVDLPGATVAAYLRLFLDVQGRLQAGTWIIREVIGVPLDQPPSIASLMLSHAWRRGPGVVDAWLDFLACEDAVHDLSTEIGRRRAALQLLIDVQQLPFDATTNFSLLRRAHFTFAHSRKIADSTGASEVFCAIATQSLGQIAWREHEIVTELADDVWQKSGSGKAA